MAAYSKDDFYYGSDFSEFSDNDADQEPISDGEISSDNEDDILRYCLCGLPATTDMIACDESDCKIEWFHYECVGLTAQTVPEDSWMCDLCQAPNDLMPVPSNPTTSTEPDVSAASLDDKDTHEGEQQNPKNSEVLEKGKQMQTAPQQPETTKDRKVKKGKPKVKRPAQKFTKEHALSYAVNYMKIGLERIKAHPLFSGNFPMAPLVMSLVVALLNASDTSKFKEFSYTLVSALWIIVTSGDDKFLQPEAMDLVWKAFHQFKLRSIKEWKLFLASLQIQTDGKHCHVVYQHLLLDLVTLIIKDRNNADSPQNNLSSDVILTKEEEQVLRYAAGYVPFALCEKFRKQKNETAAKFCKVLSAWRICLTDTAKTFLEYTNDWINVQNRGGLFHVKDDVYLLFRTMENEVRPILSKENLEKCAGQNIKSSLREKILSKHRVHEYWCNLTKDNITGNSSRQLLDMVVNLWIKIRIKAFLKVYLDLKKANNQVSKKAEKALRKELAK